jgi:dipeptidyl aminopeptidase/acylaminoacyl peptidase
MHLGAKYPDRFAALVISSGPIVYDKYPFDRIKGKMGLLVIHGDKDTSNPLEASKKMADAAKAAGVNTVYATVPGGEHLTAYLAYASEIFDFLDTQKKP